MALISFAGRAALRVILMAAGLGLLGGLAAQSQDLDCNENGISDQLDVRGQFSLRAPKVIPRGSRELLPTFVIGDFTGSTDTDLLVSTSEGLKVFLGDGTGDFSPGDPAFVQRNLIPLIAADFDGDSDLDIFGYDLEALFSEFLLSTNENRERLELGKAVNAVDSGRLATAADLDLDGDLDLGFLSDRQSAFFVQNNLGNGDFSVPEKHSFESVLTVPRSWLATRLWFEDLDANGSPDALILGSGPLRHYQEDILALNSGSGSFGDLRQLFAGLLIGSCVPADVDQDGKTDLVATVRTCCPEGGQATVMRQTGIAEFTPVEPSVSYEGYLYLTQRTDLDLDGFPEVLCATDKMSLMLRSQGAETFGDLQRVHVDAFATFEDVSGDGYPDAIAAAGSGLIVALNEGDGRHVTANQYSVPYTVPGLVSGDLDGDGDQDLLSSNVLRNQGDGEFDVELVAKNLLSGESLALLDLDLDGDLDVVVGNPDFLGCFETRSDGRLAPCPRINPGVARLGAMAPVDFNQDGAVDLVVGSAASDATGISVLSLRGHFRFQALTSLALTEVPIGIVAGDLDADGDPDFAIRTGLQRGIKRILNLSGSTLQSAPELEVSAGVSDLKVADLNGDLLPDIVVGHRSPAGVSVVLATLPPGSYAEPRVTAMPGAVEAIQPVDLDGNGTQELKGVFS